MSYRSHTRPRTKIPRSGSDDDDGFDEATGGWTIAVSVGII